MTSIEEAKRVDYEFFPSDNRWYDSEETIVTIIIDCYYNLDLVKESVCSILDQDYPNVELLLIDNGAIVAVSDYIKQVYDDYKNVALVKFKENQFSWSDTQKTVVICWNIGVLHAKGEIISHLSYDDMLSQNCCSKMVKLFNENSNCVTAGPLPVSIDYGGSENKEFSERLKINNSRGRYLAGRVMVLDFISGSTKKYFSAPGGVLFIKKNIVIETGGFDRSSDITQIIKFSVFGDCGFDSDAKLYWRHHKGQLNKIAKGKGITWCNTLTDVVKSERILQIWKRLFTRGEIELLKKYIRVRERNEVVSLAVGHVRRKNLRVFLKYIINTSLRSPYYGLVALVYSFIEITKMINQKFMIK